LSCQETVRAPGRTLGYQQQHQSRTQSNQQPAQYDDTTFHQTRRSMGDGAMRGKPLGVKSRPSSNDTQSGD
jgi:hypothetical protein